MTAIIKIGLIELGLFLPPAQLDAGQQGPVAAQPPWWSALWNRLIILTGTPVAAGLLAGMVVVLLFLVVAALKRRRRPKTVTQHRRPGGDKTTINEAVTTTGTGRNITSPKAYQNLPLQQQIQIFFFNLFKLQSGLELDAPGQMYKVETLGRCPENVYLMRLKQGRDWSVRRMSIGLLSAGAGSRSQCFYVIYDTHMVVKIPPQPINDFYSYNRQIAREGRIAHQLAPLPCIVPRVSVILRKVHSLPYVEDQGPEEQEKRYKNLVETRPEFQQYLKIGGSFVFFMELSKHFFLSRTLEDVHGDIRSVTEEIASHGELIWDQSGFLGRYGDEAWTVSTQMTNIYSKIESKLRRWCSDAGLADICSQYQLRKWFIECVSRFEQDRPDDNADGETVDQKAVKFIEQLLSGYKESVQSFRSMIQGHLKARRYEMTRVWRRNLSCAMLELLDWLAEKKVAMRDLKPENLYVAGEPSKYPHFLNDIGSFSMGLIDMETAVVMERQPEKVLDQPQLGGTPLYATPSHFLPNKALEILFKDVERVLHLQDWYAVVAIIFKIITGRSLFPKTAGCLPDILGKLRAKKKARDKLRVMVNQSSNFWSMAAQEFEINLSSHIGFFDGIPIVVPAAMAADLGEALQSRVKKLGSRIDNLLNRQAIFKHAGQKRRIQTATSDYIERSRMKLLARMETEPSQGEVLSQAVKFLEQVRLLKFRTEQHLSAIESLSADSRRISPVSLLEAMFYTVMNFMYPEKWHRRRSVRAKNTVADDRGNGTTFLPTV